ncbi:MAG: hypothetical protein AB7F20_04640 [Geoalkalibacter sp.]|jgi:hypothetical protein|uniref:hypothetical protein n=1 Tax=Geoalkalibacter sp. TaxID=3041440 RepID=UPI002A9A4F0E|nr:hypothetical protein [Thermodesulfobacteriota bacterium]
MMNRLLPALLLPLLLLAPASAPAQNDKKPAVPVQKQKAPTQTGEQTSAPLKESDRKVIAAMEFLAVLELLEDMDILETLEKE